MITALALTFAVWPQHLCVSAAGLSLESEKLFVAGWKDPQTGWFATKSRECDGSHRSIIITKDRHVVESRGFDVPEFGLGYDSIDVSMKIQPRSFEARTLHGVAMGDSAASVMKKLGSPHKRFREGERRQFDVLSYGAVWMFDKEIGTSLTNEYVFKQGTLIEVRLFLNSIPGC